MPKVWLAVVFLILFSPAFLKDEGRMKHYWIVWNVGQGQWATLVDEKSCRHFDMGGEKNPLPRLHRLCGGKENFISLSHWDLDHVGFALRARKFLPKACLETPPLGKSSPYKMKILSAFAKCSDNYTSPAKELTHFSSADLRQKTNELSHVFLVAQTFLIPGDSTAKQEKIWSENAELGRTKFLLLGHHGSRTSTSEELLSHLRTLKTAVASARFAKYGHPHQEVVRRLQKYHVPLLKTEDWGNLWFENP